jgi:hypothetical protein
MNHRLRRTYESIVFNPFPDDWPNEMDRLGLDSQGNPVQFNMYSKKLMCTPENCKEEYEKDHDQHMLDMLEYFVQYVLCDGDYPSYDFLTKVLVSKLWRPWLKIPLIITLTGSQGSGKSQFIQAYGKLFGPYFVPTSSASDIVGRFTGILEGALVAYGNETYDPEKKGSNSRQKSLGSEPFMRIELKGVDTKIAKNFVLLLQDSNHIKPLKLDLDSRREYILKGANFLCNHKQFYDELNYILKYKDGRPFMSAWLYTQFLRIGGEEGLEQFNSGHNYQVMTPTTLETRLLSATAPEVLIFMWLKRGFHSHPNLTKHRVCHPEDRRHAFKKYIQGDDGKVRPKDQWLHLPVHKDFLDGDSLWLTRVAAKDVYEAYMKQEGIAGEKMKEMEFFSYMRKYLLFDTRDNKRVREHCWKEGASSNNDRLVDRPVGARYKEQVLYFKPLRVQKANFKQVCRNWPDFDILWKIQSEKKQRRKRGEPASSDTESEAEDSAKGPYLPRSSDHPAISCMIHPNNRKIPKPPMWRPEERGRMDSSGNPIMRNYFHDPENRKGWSKRPFDRDAIRRRHERLQSQIQRYKEAHADEFEFEEEMDIDTDDDDGDNDRPQDEEVVPQCSCQNIVWHREGWTRSTDSTHVPSVDLDDPELDDRELIAMDLRDCGNMTITATATTRAPTHPPPANKPKPTRKKSKSDRAGELEKRKNKPMGSMTSKAKQTTLDESFLREPLQNQVPHPSDNEEDDKEGQEDDDDEEEEEEEEEELDTSNKRNTYLEEEAEEGSSEEDYGEEKDYDSDEGEEGESDS